jgi:hypothetical protein
MEDANSLAARNTWKLLTTRVQNERADMKVADARAAAELLNARPQVTAPVVFHQKPTTGDAIDTETSQDLDQTFAAD